MEELRKYSFAKRMVMCESVEDALVLLKDSCRLDPIVTFAPTADVLDKLTLSFRNADGRALVVIYGAGEDQAVSTQSHLIEACRNLIGPAKDRAD